MHPAEYQKKALRTMAPQQKILDRLVQLGPKAVQADNALRGLQDELGEIASKQKKWVEYGGEKPDRVNVVEEGGDLVWRTTQWLDAHGVTLEEAMNANIAKLAERYPESYSDHLAQEENRDRPAEYMALKGVDSQKEGVVPPSTEARQATVDAEITMLLLRSNPEPSVHRYPDGVVRIEASGRARVQVRQDGNIVLCPGGATFMNVAGAEELAACLVKAVGVVDPPVAINPPDPPMQHVRSGVVQDGRGFGHAGEGV